MDTEKLRNELLKGWRNVMPAHWGVEVSTDVCPVSGDQLVIFKRKWPDGKWREIPLNLTKGGALVGGGKVGQVLLDVRSRLEWPE